MKHLKTYEALNGNDIKKYMVYQHKNKVEYYLDEFVKIENDIIVFTKFQSVYASIQSIWRFSFSLC